MKNYRITHGNQENSPSVINEKLGFSKTNDKSKATLFTKKEAEDFYTK